MRFPMPTLALLLLSGVVFGQPPRFPDEFQPPIPGMQNPPPPVNRIPYRGSEYFRFFLHQKGLKPLSTAKEAFANPTDSIIISLGNAEWLNNPQLVPNSLKSFVDAGGAVLIACESEVPNENTFVWHHDFGVNFSNRKFEANQEHCFEGKEDSPFLKPRSRLPFLANDSPFEMFAGIRSTGKDAVTTQLPTIIRVEQIVRRNYVLTSLAGLPESARDDRNFGIASGQDHVAVSIRRSDRPGRLLLIANSAIFINGSMRFSPDETTGELTFPNANVQFAKQVIDWMKGPNESRTHCLFVQNSQVIDQFAKEVQLPPDQQPPIPPIPPDVLANLIFRMANPMLAEVQNRARPNNALNRWPGPERLQKFFIGAATVFFLWLIWSLLSRTTRKDDKSRWTSLASLGGLLAKGNTSKRKRNDLVETGNIYEAAKWRIRDRFDRLGGEPDDEGVMPPILMADNSKQASGLEASIKRLWNIGYGEKAVGVTIAMWDELNLDLERAVKLAGKGLWCFAAHAIKKS